MTTEIQSRTVTAAPAETPNPAAAPGDLEEVRQFANTVDVEGGSDSLATRDGAQAWLRARGLVSALYEVTDTERERLVVVRDALRQMLLHNAGGPFDAEAAAAINAAAVHSPLVMEASEAGMRLVPAGRGVDAVIARLLGIVVGAEANGRWPRLKICHMDACRWAFYDHSKNRSGRWCSMAVCGNRAKARAFRERQAADLR
jgi:predicted RNA-binding Zn ribbon-like protein